MRASLSPIIKCQEDRKGDAIALNVIQFRFCSRPERTVCSDSSAARRWLKEDFSKRVLCKFVVTCWLEKGKLSIGCGERRTGVVAIEIFVYSGCHFPCQFLIISFLVCRSHGKVLGLLVDGEIRENVLSEKLSQGRS